MNAALSAAVAHDVKNRLVILAEELSALAALALPEKAQTHVAAANEQATMLTNKLVEWLVVQRASEGAGLRALPHEEVPDLFLDDLHGQALPLGAGRVQIVKQLGELPDFWFYDAQLVRLAIDSALHNALRFAKSRITLGARMSEGRLCFFVHDDGPGLSTEPSTTSTGLGMSLCREVALAHTNRGAKGESTLRNHPGGGTLFELHLP